MTRSKCEDSPDGKHCIHFIRRGSWTGGGRPDYNDVCCHCGKSSMEIEAHGPYHPDKKRLPLYQEPPYFREDGKQMLGMCSNVAKFALSELE